MTKLQQRGIKRNVTERALAMLNVLELAESEYASSGNSESITEDVGESLSQLKLETIS